MISVEVKSINTRVILANKNIIYRHDFLCVWGAPIFFFFLGGGGPPPAPPRSYAPACVSSRAVCFNFTSQLHYPSYMSVDGAVLINLIQHLSIMDWVRIVFFFLTEINFCSYMNWKDIA